MRGEVSYMVRHLTAWPVLLASKNELSKRVTLAAPFDRDPKLLSSPRNATPVPCAVTRRVEPWRLFVANEFTVNRADRMRGAK